ncbi:MAG: histidine--tRNA ligase [Anaerolineaceae bacterium]|nr:histidine--tRNA ligase [Anaerolineaceae bacterium]MDE0329080.1 histidine--tRNA ligase [Anaerolineaceae bacterium]
MPIRPRLPRGMRDFLPADMLRREYVFGIVRAVFERYGFEPLQTPALELNEILSGKYGEDAERLIYHAQHPGGREALALRYDLTVPLARVVGQHRQHIALPFKRYQLAPVWRAERPQRGRYREFMQCDADIVGVAGMSADAEVLGVVHSVLSELGFPQFTMRINNRKLLTAIGQFSGVPDARLGDLWRSIDKFDRIGAAGVRGELVERGIDAEAVARVMELIAGQAGESDPLGRIDQAMGGLAAAREGLGELRELTATLDAMGLPTDAWLIDFTMVRGLGYYTGPIFETVIEEPNLGSISGGGRYDRLIGLFRRDSLPTTGVSLGIERIIDLMDALDLYPASLGGTVVQALVAVIDEETRPQATRLAADLRQAGIRCELHLEARRLGRQLQAADRRGIPLVVLQGGDELARGQVRIRRLADGSERTVSRHLAVAEVARLLA